MFEKLLYNVSFYSFTVEPKVQKVSGLLERPLFLLYWIFLYVLFLVICIVLVWFLCSLSFPSLSIGHVVQQLLYYIYEMVFYYMNYYIIPFIFIMIKLFVITMIGLS